MEQIKVKFNENNKVLEVIFLVDSFVPDKQQIVGRVSIEILSASHNWLSFLMPMKSCKLFTTSDESVLILGNLYVKDIHRNNGIGKKIMEFIFTDRVLNKFFPNIKTIILEANPDESSQDHLPLQPLINFYKKFGFNKIANKYYENPNKHINLMIKYL